MKHSKDRYRFVAGYPVENDVLASDDAPRMRVQIVAASSDVAVPRNHVHPIRQDFKKSVCNLDIPAASGNI